MTAVGCSLFLLVIASYVMAFPQQQGYGQEQSQQQKVCVTDCPQARIPICASDGRIRVEFNNVCILHSYNCRNNKNLQFANVGTC